MRSLISFPYREPRALLEQKNFFIAVVHKADADRRGLESLTPRLLSWEDDSTILDMQPCLDFWFSQAKEQQKALTACWQEQLNCALKTQEYFAALAETPWQAILLARLLEERSCQGLVSHTSRFGGNLLKSLSWDIWWAAAETYAIHKEELRQCKLGVFQQQKRSMQTAMQRLGCLCPAQIKSMPSSHIRRRFGSLLAELWELSFLEGRAADDVFPWRGLSFQDSPKVKRHLDFPACDWATIEAYLADDLNRLCVLDSFKKGERILKLEWMIVLYNLQKIPVSILFRHPHSLHHETPTQRTALLQISYSFQNLWHKLQNDENAWIVSWTLEVQDKVPPRPRQGSLFHESHDDWNSLLSLENMLCKSLEAFQVMEDWVPEDSFARTEGTHPPSREFSQDDLLLGRQRPLFLYEKPRRLTHESAGGRWHFRERTMDKWWRSPSSNRTRDYYQFIRDREMLWIFRNGQGEWFEQGVYG